MLVPDLPSALIAEVLSHLNAADMANAICSCRCILSTVSEAVHARLMRESLPMPNLLGISPSAATRVLRMCEVREKDQRFCIAAVGVTHHLWVVDGQLLASGLDPEDGSSASTVLGVEEEEEEDTSAFEHRISNGAIVVSAVRGCLTSIEVVEVAAGAVHSLVLSAAGAVYSFGRNSFGQLGEPITAQTVSRGRGPRAVEGLPMPCQHVSTGDHYSLVLATDGELFAFGSNHYGELGLGPVRVNVDVPTRVAQSATQGGRPLQQAAGGRSHTLHVTLNGSAIWSCGRNDYVRKPDPNPCPWSLG